MRAVWVALVVWMALVVNSCPGPLEKRRNAELAAIDYVHRVNPSGTTVRVSCTTLGLDGSARCTVMVNGILACLYCDTDNVSDSDGCMQAESNSCSR